MSSLVDTLEHAGLVLSGAVVCYVLLKWRERQTARGASNHAKELLDKARQESEILLRDSRLMASQEVLKAREQFEQAQSARRTERIELERRLTERETLINSQLQRIVESEQALGQQKEALDKQLEQLHARDK